MRQISTTAIVLNRINYGEADRILTLLTPDQGKLRVMAKGVRRVKSKLAGGIELFSVIQINFIRGRSDIGTLTSTRLEKYYSNIVQDLDRTTAGFELIKLFNKVTEDEPEPEYFGLLRQVLESLDDHAVPILLVRVWCAAQLLSQAGHTPNLKTDTEGHRLLQDRKYSLDFERMTLAPSPNGRVGADQVKFLRLIFDHHTPKSLARISGTGELAQALAPLVDTMLKSHIRV